MIIAHAVIEHWQLKPGVLVSVLSNYTLAFITLFFNFTTKVVKLVT